MANLVDIEASHSEYSLRCSGIRDNLGHLTFDLVANVGFHRLVAFLRLLCVLPGMGEEVDR